MQLKTKLYCDLLEIIEKQDEVIRKQKGIIAKLVNETAEQET